MPKSPVFLSVLKRFGKPIAAPSANESGYISSTKAIHVFDSFKKKVDLIIEFSLNVVPFSIGSPKPLKLDKSKILKLLKRLKYFK